MSACFAMLKVLAISKTVLSPTIFQMNFPVHSHSKEIIQYNECCRKGSHRLASSFFICMSTALLSWNSNWWVNVFCFADIFIWLSPLATSCDPFYGTVPNLIDFFNRFFFLPLSLLRSFHFWNTLFSFILFQELHLRKNSFQSLHHFFQTSFFYRVCVVVFPQVQ